VAHSQDTVSADLKPRARQALLIERSNSKQCPEQKDTTPCPPSKFRTPSGECNNVNHRDWGARGDVFLRLLNPSYADGVSQPRTSSSSHALPSADYVIKNLQKNIDEKAEHPHITAMLPAWGQLLAYDLVGAITPKNNIKCCRDNNSTNNFSEELVQCYVRMGENCKEYKRSVPSYDYSSCEFSK
jgi:peroxidase